MTWTRADIEGLNYWDRPKVRARIGGLTTDAEIAPDRNSVFVFTKTGGQYSELRISWGLLLDVLNDPRTAPIEIEPGHRERPPAIPKL